MDDINQYKAKLLESTYDVVIITDNNIDSPIIRYVNKAFTNLIGFTKEEVTGQTPRIGVRSPDDRKRTLRTKSVLIKSLTTNIKSKIIHKYPES